MCVCVCVGGVVEGGSESMVVGVYSGWGVEVGFCGCVCVCVCVCEGGRV